MTQSGNVGQLKRELETFEAQRERLLGESLGKYVLIHEDDVVSVYDSEFDAINDAYRRFGNVPFLVKKIVPHEEPANFVSGIVRV